MLKLLVKKQLYEIFRGYFVNQKTGKVRSKKKQIAFICMFVFVMLCLGVMFFGMATTMAPLIDTPFSWLYFAVLGLISIGLGTFGSAFNTYSMLYQAKDNDLLLSMPIPQSTLLMSRMVSVFALSLMYSACVWIPACIEYGLYKGPTALAIILEVFLTIGIAFFVTVISCALGWLIALISTKLKNKGLISALVTVVFLGAYYAVCFKLSNFIEALILDGEGVSKAIKGWMNLIYQLARGAEGNIVSALFFMLIVAALSVLCLRILSRGFVKIVTKSAPVKKVSKEIVPVKASSNKNALFKRELKRFTSSSAYMLNCGFGLAIMPVVAIIMLVRGESLSLMLSEMSAAIPMIGQFIPLAVAVIMCMIINMNAISTPSISLEGKNLWILKSLPIDPLDVLMSKERLHATLNGGVGIVSAILFGIAVKLSFSQIAGVSMYILMFSYITAAFGLIIDLLRPNLNWTHEAYPTKQNLNIIFSMLFGIVVLGVTVLGAYFLREKVEIDSFILYGMAAFCIVVRFMNKWLASEGVRRFGEL